MEVISTVTIIRAFDPPIGDFTDVGRQRLRKLKKTLESARPRPRFPYRISFAESYEQLRSGAFTSVHLPLSSLVPNDVHPFIALHGSGGTGKTHVLHRVLLQLIGDDSYVMLLDLKRYQQQPTTTGAEADPLIDDVLGVASIPRMTRSELQRIASQESVFVLIDAFNEVTRQTRAMILDWLATLRRHSRIYAVIADRLGFSEDLIGFRRAMIEPLGSSFVRSLLDARLVYPATRNLSDASLALYQTPFFLSLALRSRRPTALATRAGMMTEFLAQHLRLSRAELRAVAHAVLAAADPHSQAIIPSRLRASLPQASLQRLSDILSRDLTHFEHHLWRDYMLGLELAADATSRTPTTFDTATTYALSLDSLSLALEQVESAGDADDLVQTVFDWNYFAAAQAISDCARHSGVTSASRAMHAAILASIAEKRDDRVQRTQRRAAAALREDASEHAQALLALPDLAGIAGYVSRMSSDSSWYQQWLAIFRILDAATLSAEQIALISSSHSLIGWGVANALRRGTRHPHASRFVRSVYDSALGDEFKSSIRWRAVHALGAYPELDNVALLSRALAQDQYGWVRYGAARALMETAADAADVREPVAAALLTYVRGSSETDEVLRRRVWEEIVQMAFIAGPVPGWTEFARPLLREIADREPADQQRSVLQTLVAQFEELQVQ